MSARVTHPFKDAWTLLFQTVSEKTHEHLDPKELARMVSKYNKHVDLGDLDKICVDSHGGKNLTGLCLRAATVKMVNENSFDEALLRDVLADKLFENGAILNTTGKKQPGYKNRNSRSARSGAGAGGLGSSSSTSGLPKLLPPPGSSLQGIALPAGTQSGMQGTIMDLKARLDQNALNRATPEEAPAMGQKRKAPGDINADPTKKSKDSTMGDGASTSSAPMGELISRPMTYTGSSQSTLIGGGLLTPRTDPTAQKNSDQVLEQLLEIGQRNQKHLEELNSTVVKRVDLESELEQMKNYLDQNLNDGMDQVKADVEDKLLAHTNEIDYRFQQAQQNQSDRMGEIKDRIIADENFVEGVRDVVVTEYASLTLQGDVHDKIVEAVLASIEATMNARLNRIEDDIKMIEEAPNTGGVTQLDLVADATLFQHEMVEYKTAVSNLLKGGRLRLTLIDEKYYVSEKLQDGTQKIRVSYDNVERELKCKSGIMCPY